MKPADYIKRGTEYEHQVALFMQIAQNLKKYPDLKWAHSITNEERSGSVIVGTKAKALGRTAGVSDISIPIKRIVALPQGGFVTYSGLYVELKKLKAKGVGPSKEQLEFGEFVTAQGFAFSVCYGWQEAWETIELYINLK